jgi:hypothetical protein
MTSQTLGQRDPHNQGESSPAGRQVGASFGRLPHPGTRGSRSLAPHFAHRPFGPPEEALTAGELEEVLVTDPRGCLSPSQVVEQKLLALLQTGQLGASPPPVDQKAPAE